MNFSQKSPKMFKIASDIFIHAFLLFLGLFLKIFRWMPLNTETSANAAFSLSSEDERLAPLLLEK